MSTSLKNGNSSSLSDPRLLALASLFEEDFSIDWLEELTSKKASYILTALGEAIDQGWLASKGPGLFCFKDLKKRQSWLAQLTQEEKERFHRGIANLLLRDLPEDNRKAQTIVCHLFHIINDAEKCRYLIKAGDSLRKDCRIEEALKCYTKVLDDILSTSGEEADSVFVEAAIKYSKISTARHDTTKVLSVLQEAMSRAVKWEQEIFQALLGMHLAKNEWLCSRFHNALEQFQQGWSIAKRLDDPKLMASVTTFSTSFLFWQGRFQEAINIYEKSIPDVEKYPKGRFSLLATVMVGRCYVHTGQVTQGLGMIDSIRTHCLEKGDRFLAAHAEIAMGNTMLDIHRIDDAIHYLERSVKMASEAHNHWARIVGKLSLSFAYYLREENRLSIAYLSEFLCESQQVHVTMQPVPYLIELSWAMNEGKIPHIAGLSFDGEVNKCIESENIYLKGIAYRYKSFIQKQRGQPNEEIIQSLNISLKWLEESGCKINQCKTQLELARQYLLIGEEKKAEEATLMASKLRPSWNGTIFSDDLKSFVKNPTHRENFISEIMMLSQEMATNRDIKNLVHQIISAGNRITGAERGTIFLWDNNEHPASLALRASKNISSEQLNHQSFSSSMNLIKEVALTGKGRIVGMSSAKSQSSPSNDIIRSCICVPMILRNKVIGVLYNDNRLLSSAFKESDLEILAYFAAQAAIALDNTTAYEEIKRLNQKLREEKLYFEEQDLQTIHFENIVGESPAIMNVLAKVDHVASTDATVLILGETGVGKELIARALHRHSPRSHKSFIRVSCSTLPETLIPSELFGHERGAFTGALRRRIGRFELADGGTLFLDEIGDLSLEVQVRLLGVLQNKEFERVGGNETIRSDFRLVAATNRDLEQAVKAGKFRPDLYYRLNVFPIHVPPLKERKEDIPSLAHYFLKIYATKMGKTFDGIPKSEMDKLIQYNWPGNVRELENIIERGTILSSGPLFRVPELGVNKIEFADSKEDTTLSGKERHHILWALQKTRWKVRGFGGAAELLNIHPSTLEFRMKKLGIRRPPEFSRRVVEGKA